MREKLKALKVTAIHQFELICQAMEKLKMFSISYKNHRKLLKPLMQDLNEEEKMKEPEISISKASSIPLLITSEYFDKIPSVNPLL